MLFWAEHCRSQPSAIRESMPVVSGFTLVPTFSNPSCATIRRKLLQKAPRGEGPLLACRLPVSEEKTATNEGDCNRNEQGSSAPRLSGSSDLRTTSRQHGMQKKKQAVLEHVNAGLQRRPWACRSRKAGRAWRLYPSRALLAVELLVGATGVELITQRACSEQSPHKWHI